MRKIKFRGLDISGTWIYFDLDFTEQNFFINSKNVNIDRKTVGQFTGLTDKNGIEIYEGDIVKVDIFTKNYCIVFGESKKWGASFQYKSDYSIYYLTENFAKDCVVVGNIYENPELV